MTKNIEIKRNFLLELVNIMKEVKNSKKLQRIAYILLQMGAPLDIKFIYITMTDLIQQNYN